MVHLPKGLPSLHGRRGTIVRWLHGVLAATVIAILIAGAAYEGLYAFRDVPAEARYGLRLIEDEAGRPSVWRATPAAVAAGIVPGNRIVGLDGKPLPAGTTLLDAGARIAREAGPLVLDQIDDAGHVSGHRLSRRQNIDGMRDVRSGLTLDLLGILLVAEPLIVAAILVAISLLLARKRPRDPEAMLLAIGFLLLAYYEPDDFWFWQMRLPAIPAIYGWVQNMLMIVGYWAMFVGLCAFPDGRFASRWARIAWMVPTTYVIANAATNFTMWATMPLLTRALDIPIFIVVVGSVLIRFRSAPRGIQRQQIKWVLFGGAVMIMAAIIAFVVESEPVAPHLGATAVYLLAMFHNDVVLLAFPIGLLVSLLRYRLYDADTVITRSTVYAILTISLVAVFACTEKVIEVLGEEYFGRHLGALAGGLGAAVSAVMIAPLHHRISHWAEYRFRHELIQLRNSLPVLIGDLRETASPVQLSETVLRTVTHAMHTSRGLIVGRSGSALAVHGISKEEQDYWLANNSVEGESHVRLDRTDRLLPFHVPLAIDTAPPVGWLLLGARPDDSLYGKDERDTVAEVAESIARGLSVAEWRMIQTEADKRERTDIRKRIASLEKALSKLLKATVPKA